MKKTKKILLFFCLIFAFCMCNASAVLAKDAQTATVQNIQISHEKEIVSNGTMITVSCEIYANYPIDDVWADFEVYSGEHYIKSERVHLNYDNNLKKYVGYLKINAAEMYEGYYELDNDIGVKLDDTFISANNKEGKTHYFRYSDTCLRKGHTWVAGNVAKESTCTEEGTQVYNCKICALERNETIPKLPHRPYTIEGEPASCEYDGYTEKVCCHDCDTVLKDSVVIPATGHRHTQILNKKEPTAVESGYTGDVYCTDCESYISEGEYIDTLPATGKLSITDIVLKKGKSWNVRVSDLAAGDSVAFWISSNSKVVTVNQSGKVSAKKKGTARIAAVLESGEWLIAKVKVQNGTVKTSKVTVNTRKLTLNVGQKYQIFAERYPLTSSQKITYSSAKKKIATVNKNGWVQAKKKGKTTISVKSGSKKVKVQVVVR